MASALRVGFLGAGKMATALAEGFVRGGAVVGADRIAVSCPEQVRMLYSKILPSLP